MAIQCAYRSRAPGVLQAVRDAEAAVNAYKDGIFAILADHGFAERQIAVANGGFQPGAFLGVVPQAGESAPEGWRTADRGGTLVFVPDNRTRAGKAVTADLARVQCPRRVELPGMPGEAFVPEDHRFCLPGCRVLEDGAAVYVTWSTVLEAARDRRSGEPVAADEALWEPVKLSAWYAAVEAEDGAEAI